MADDVGIQASLFLLLVLSDDEVRGLASSKKGNDANDQKSSVSSNSSLSEVRGKAPSILSSSSKLKKKKQKVKS